MDGEGNVVDTPKFQHDTYILKAADFHPIRAIHEERQLDSHFQWYSIYQRIGDT